MTWEKKGLIYRPHGDLSWSRSHAQVPVVDVIDGDRFRIYFGTRDASNHTVTSFIEVSASDPSEVLYIHDRPVLGLGELGCFDDSGAMPSWLVNTGDAKLLYYIGWNESVTVPYRNAIGIARSDDGGRTFQRLFPGPVVDRSKDEPLFVGAHCVLKEENLWRLYYQVSTGWKVTEERVEPMYHIRYAESKDGVDWERNGVVAIDYKSKEEGGITRPSVLFEDGGYKMWFCCRHAQGFRDDRSRSYRIGYAESADGVRWVRNDEKAGLDVSESGWDSTMVTYPNVIQHDGKTYLFYNGNGFGASGVGYAVRA